jgi:two-component system, OmpR family, response regulator
MASFSNNGSDVLLRVLIVEDSKVLAERLREVLSALDNVEVIGSVDEEAAAVEAVKSGNVDAVVLDLQLRTGTGFGVVQKLGPQRPTIIVFTNYMLPEYERRAKDLGIQYFLNKAADYERLPQLVQELEQRKVA